MTALASFQAQQELPEPDLAELRHRYSALFEQSLYAIVLTRPDGTIVDANDTALTMFEVSREDLAAFRVEHAYVNLQDRAALLAEVRSRGSVHEYELRLRRAGGSTFLASYSGNHITTGGQVVGLIGVIRDVTVAREAEERLRQSEERLQAILAHSPDIVARHDRQLRHVYVNRAVERYTGHSAADMIGKTNAELGMPAEVCSVWQEAQLDVLATGRPRFVKFGFPGLSGDSHFEAHMVPERDEDGNVRSVLTFSRDVTDLRATEAALEQSEAKFRAIIENGNEIIALLDAEGFIRYVSPAVRSADATAAEVTGLNLATFVDPADWPRVHEVFSRAARTSEAREHVSAYRAVNPAGRTLWFEASFTNMLHHPAIAAIVMHARDVTGQVEAEAARNRVEEQFRQSQKMEAIGRLAGGVAHDFNNLLTAITGSAELALDATADAELRADLETIRSAAYRAAAITRQLLAFSRKQMTTPRVVNVNEAMQSFEPLLRRLVSAEVAVELSLESTSAIDIDPVQLEQALLNLAVNASDAMPKGGTIVVHTATSGDEAVIEVRDTGVGIEERIRARIFEPFFTTKSPGQGTGLGLATVYGIVDQARGRVEVDSAPGKGSVFRLVFPVSTGAVATPADNAARQPTVKGTETILIVEDESSVRHPVARTLRRLGYDVIEAKHGGDALTLIAERREPVHLVITDLVMPEMGGAELIAELRASQPKLPVIFVSGYSRDVAKARGAAQEAPFLQKPFSMETLARTVRETLDRQCPARSRVA